MSKTRTKRTNGRPALLLSTVRSDRFNVRPRERRSIACPDCDVWHWINGETTLKIREHDDESGERCPSSLQVVVVDIKVDRWQKRQDRRTVDMLLAESRRPSTVLRKPQVPVAPPVHTMGRSAVRYADVPDLDARRQFLLVLNQREREEAVENQAEAARVRRSQEWAQVLPAVNAADLQRDQGPTTSAVLMPIKSLGIPLGQGTETGRKPRRRKP